MIMILNAMAGQKKEDSLLSGLDASEHSIECFPKYGW